MHLRCFCACLHLAFYSLLAKTAGQPPAASHDDPNCKGILSMYGLQDRVPGMGCGESKREIAELPQELELGFNLSTR